jgi:hypothetical protein
MGIRLKINKGPESINVAGGLLSNVKGKITLKTPFGTREIASDGSLKGGKPKKEPVVIESAIKMSTSKSTSKEKKGSK